MSTRPFQYTVLLLAASLPLSGAEPSPSAAWQQGDEALAGKCEQLTGKYIFQQACTSCHEWGPDYWPRSRWEEYLRKFPGNHQPEVRNRYRDLTAMFDVGKAVPTRKQQQDALTKFVLAAAPEHELAKTEREKPFEAFPEVGSAAPKFSLTDVEGKTFALSQFADRKALVLVFSRAHW